MARPHPSMLRHGGMGVVTLKADFLMARPHPSMLRHGCMGVVSLKADFLLARPHPSMLRHGGMGAVSLQADFLMARPHPSMLRHDDQVPFSLPIHMGATRLREGGVRATTVYCDTKAVCGAELFCAAWMTEVDMQKALLVYTRAIVASPSQYSIPGCESVEKALSFLKAEARKEGPPRTAPLRAFLQAAGVFS